MKPMGVERKAETFTGVRPSFFVKEEVKGRWESGRSRRRESIYICSTELELCNNEEVHGRRRREDLTPLTGHGMWTIFNGHGADLTKYQRLSHELMSENFGRGWAAPALGLSSGQYGHIRIRIQI